VAQLASCSPEEGVFIAAPFPNLKKRILHNLLGNKRSTEMRSFCTILLILQKNTTIFTPKIALTNPRRVPLKKNTEKSNLCWSSYL
jgi:hypothetical protein